MILWESFFQREWIFGGQFYQNISRFLRKHLNFLDALSERDWVKFTVHTRTTMTSKFARHEFSVIRLHEEFRWLHDTYSDNPDYAGFIIPPPPPKPDFDASREKLRKLGDAEGNEHSAQNSPKQQAYLSSRQFKIGKQKQPF